eukprot:TRINITY_DN3146_c1_g1_i12.p1 TRINITY_DN3146_c1_g1~~TRINITY_DN3146_c1_g1_i12.p1  ORF type:complete len:144 (-),score=1.19 TRINITY_DN3146_c1_g1_i12:251-682(-)
MYDFNTIRFWQKLAYSKYQKNPKYRRAKYGASALLYSYNWLQLVIIQAIRLRISRRLLKLCIQSFQEHVRNAYCENLLQSLSLGDFQFVYKFFTFAMQNTELFVIKCCQQNQESFIPFVFKISHIGSSQYITNNNNNVVPSPL